MQGEVSKAMGRLDKQYDKASMKKAILKQEETFRQQVHELHQLYRTQKQLMREMKNTRPHKQKCDHSDKETSPQELQEEEYTRNADVDESEIELTLAIGHSRRKREEASHTWGSGTSFSSSSSQFHAVKSDGEFDIEQRKRRERVFDQFPWSLPCLSLKIN